MVKFLRITFLILFFAAAVSTAVYTAKNSKRISQDQAAIENNQEKLGQILSELHKTNLKYRGFMESLKSIPDSTRLLEAGPINNNRMEYVKSLRTLERDEAEIKRILKKQRKAVAETKAYVKKRLFIFGGGTLVFLLGFFICARIK